MSEPFIAEIKIVGFNFAPRGYALCDGQILPINQNQALFSLLGTTYGGNGQTTFGLPDLRGRVPIHVDGGHSLGQRSGAETHTLTIAESPAHNHDVLASSDAAASRDPTNNVLATSLNLYADPSNVVAARPGTLSATGGAPHTNMQPYLALNFAIALQGLFPPQN